MRTVITGAGRSHCRAVVAEQHWRGIGTCRDCGEQTGERGKKGLTNYAGASIVIDSKSLDRDVITMFLNEP